MEDRLFINSYLANYFEEIKPKDFYRSIFPAGELAVKGEMITGKYNALAVKLLPVQDDKRNNARKYIITDDLDVIDELLDCDDFVIISPISYIGRSRQSQNARFIFALAIDLDGITDKGHLENLFHQIEKVEFIPKPTYVVWSGSGVHLYYQFKEPVPCFKNIVKQLSNLKKALTVKIWNGLVSEFAENPQIESLFQGFRMVGGITKGGNTTKAYQTGSKVDIEYLNSFVDDGYKVTEYTYKSNLTLKEAEKKYPEWYQKRIVENKRRGVWKANRAVYDWWLKELKQKIIVGHRYYGVMVLAVYAKKCGIPEEELEKDAFELVEFLESLTVEDKNHFTREDVLAALEMYNDNYITFPIDSISKLTAVYIKKNKRNGRTQKKHLERARAVQNVDYPHFEWHYHGGRPKGSKNKEVIEKWKVDNPEGTAKECIKETGLSKSTVYRFWK